MTEIWRPVVGYEGFYEISSFGNIKSLDREVWNGRGFYNKKGKVLRKTKTTTGYWKVELVRPGEKRKSKKIHRLVAEAFIGDPPEGKTLINHKDGNPLNNRVENLEWCNQLENVKHAYETKLIPSPFHDNKEKIIYEYTHQEGASIKGLAKKYCCNQRTIKKWLEENGVKIRSISEVQDTYNIDRKLMIEYFNKGLNNKEIIKRLGGNRTLIATYRYLFRKGRLKI